MTRRVRASARRRVTVSLIACSGWPITSEPTGTMTVTPFSLRTSTFIELTGTVPISLIDHEDEDAGDRFSCCPTVGRPSADHERRRPEPRLAGAGGVASVVLVGRFQHYCGQALTDQLLRQLVDELYELPAEQRRPRLHPSPRSRRPRTLGLARPAVCARSRSADRSDSILFARLHRRREWPGDLLDRQCRAGRQHRVSQKCRRPRARPRPRWRPPRPLAGCR